VACQMLLRTPDPFAHREGPLAYLLRVSEANGYETPGIVLRHAGLVHDEALHAKFSAQPLAKILGKDPASLARLKYSTMAPDGRVEYCLNGHSLGFSLAHSPLRLMHPRVCVACIGSNGFADVCWDAAAFVACPDHGNFLLARCPHCNRTLTWFRPGLLRCKCGSSLAGHNSPLAPPSVLALMRVLRSKILAEDLHSLRDSGGGMPLALLERMPLDSILRMAFAFERLDRSRGRYGEIPVVAGVLSEWPSGFHEYLRQMAGDAASSSLQTVGLRRRFEPLYQALFKRPHPLVGAGFLRDEFVQFGLREWGEAVVDSKLVGAEPVERRFVSSCTMADLLGVMPSTTRKWVDEGKLPAKVVEMKGKRHYVIDAARCEQYRRASVERLSARDAGRHIGLPVSVLQELKRRGNYSTEVFINQRAGFWSEDLEALERRLLATSSPSPAQTVVHGEVRAVTLRRILSHWKLGMKQAKGAFVAGILDGKIVPVGLSGQAIDGLLFSTSDVEEFRVHFAIQSKREALSAASVAFLMECGAHVVAGLVQARHLKAVAGSQVRVSRTSVNAFMANWRPLSKFARELNTSSQALISRSEALDIPVLRVASKVGCNTAYVAAAAVQKLTEVVSDEQRRAAAMKRPSRTAARASYKSALCAYLAGVSRGSEPLPCRSGKPNLSAIASACGFGRHVFLKQQEISRLLDRFVTSGELP
jgi:hypothetical protein